LRLKTVTASQMRSIDKKNVESRGIPSIILMERAGRGLAKEVIKLTRQVTYKEKEARVAIFCGKGNNSGDGLVCARYLLSSGINVKIYLLFNLDLLKGSPAYNIQALKKQGAIIYEINSYASFKKLSRRINANIIVDSIFGIGFKGKPSRYLEEVIEFLNKQKACIVSVDVPSGLDATTGIARAGAIIADKTVTFGLSKTGFYKNDGPIYCGKISIIDIGLKV